MQQLQLLSLSLSLSLTPHPSVRRAGRRGHLTLSHRELEEGVGRCICEAAVLRAFGVQLCMVPTRRCFGRRLPHAIHYMYL